MSQVIDAMEPWKHESQFGDFIAEQSTFPTAPPSPVSNIAPLKPRRQDLQALELAYQHLQQLQKSLLSNNEDASAVDQLMSFIRGIRKTATTPRPPGERFELLNPLRSWLFWLPVLFLQGGRGTPYGLLTLAYYYTIALVVEPIFPDVGAAYFGSMSLGPIEEIARRLWSHNIAGAFGEDILQTPLALMQYPIDMVTAFRQRRGWRQPTRTASFPVFPQHGEMPFDLATTVSIETDNIYAPYGSANPAFSYSQEHLSPARSFPPSATSPFTLSPHFPDNSQFLNVPSPLESSNHEGSYHSPSGSSYEDFAYSDQGGESDQFATLLEPPAFHANAGSGLGFGGFVPHTVWI
jgi:hypothetical protein